MGRNVLVIGAGGREHALTWRLAASPSVDRVVTAPGNPGTAECGPNLPVDATDPAAVADLAERESIDLVVVGPEAPLVAGVVDELQRREIPAFGPTAAGAHIEGSKAFAKDVMEASGAPTGGYVATSERDEAYDALDRFGGPYVVKADGLAAGKGVRICASRDEARDAVDDALVRGVFGHAGSRVVVEQFLLGPERSVFGVCDGDDVVLLAPAQDYKRALDGDEGLNTGGMGAYTPVPGFTLDDVDHLRELVFLPVLRELADRGVPYRGLLYAGLVDTIDGPQLLEFNARFGDPETQVILPKLASDLGDLLHASAVGSVGDVEVTWHDDAVVTVVLASGGYPEGYATGIEIAGVDEAAGAPGVTIFHAGTSRGADGQLVTAGGRVLNVTARGSDVAEARVRAYAAADRISWDGRQRRGDIAARV
ncbi:phosphoribosylamine--glycine ligase [Nitriliruptor alkaliphilus]|uniref:phosphoribosylamine--glycine ligase n=1 Tax=Nitriliruptor alkaliphilus TaxID=427918 RepID=UPI000AD3087F|nr:phosphoribosylamine--glycine ligase [Nitriliruptor alkaliphilus]